MDFFKKFDLNGTQFVKLIGLGVGALVVLYIVATLLSGFGWRQSGFDGVGGMNIPNMSPTLSYKNSGVASESATLSVRNMSDSYMPPTQNGYATGDESEAYEVKEYSARIETGNLDKECGDVRALKAREDVVFENANEYKRGCTYSFKVKKDSVEEVLGIIKALDPKELSENSHTIKREVDDYTSEIQILEQKLATLEKTLTDATASYESITTLATSVGNVESLAKIIESKLTIIERLTNARIETSNQLERMNRAKTDSLDRLLYTYFTVEVYENKFVDGEEIQNSWKFAVQQFVRESNRLVQELSIGLVAFLLAIVKFALYFVVILFVVRIGWTFAQKIWKTGEKR